MQETIGLLDLNVNYHQPVAEALHENHFINFRVNPTLRQADSFPPTQQGIRPMLGHQFQVPAGYSVAQLSTLMFDRVITPVRDIREIIAFAAPLHKEWPADDRHKLELWFFAPQLTDEETLFFKICRWKDWDGFGLTKARFNPEDDNLWELELAGISSP